MLSLPSWLALTLLCSAVASAAPSGQVPLTAVDRSHPSQQPAKSVYHALPSLKEQDAMETRWLERRYQRLGEILRK